MLLCDITTHHLPCDIASFVQHITYQCGMVYFQLHEHVFDMRNVAEWLYVQLYKQTCECSMA